MTVRFDETWEPSAASSGTYQWGNVPVGGGGYITDLIAHPLENGLFYLRTDNGGAYRKDVNSSAWVNVADMFDVTRENYYGIDGIAIDPNDPNTLYICAGKSLGARPSKIMKSTDRGASWTELGGSFKFAGNGDQRWIGEPIMVDPNNSSVIYCGTRENGLQRSLDGGANWTKMASVPVGPTSVGIRTAAIDPATVLGGRSKRVYAAVRGTGIYMSDDAGGTWKLMSGSPVNVNRMAVVSGTLYVSSAAGVHKYMGSWSDISPTAQGYTGLAVDPANANRVVVSVEYRTSGVKPNRVPSYYSSDGGVSWSTNRIASGTSTRVFTVPWYPSHFFAAATCTLAFDPFSPNRIWFGDWYGTWVTEDITASNVVWTQQVSGIEQTSVLALLSLPAAVPDVGEAILSGMADNKGFLHADMQAYPSAYHASNIDTSGFDFCESSPANVFAAGQDGAAAWSADGGKTWSAASWPYGENGKVAVSATNPDLAVVVPVGLAPKRTINRGSSWLDTTGATSGAITSKWHNDLMIASDRVNGAKFYFLHTNGAFYRSSDGGATWTKTNTIPSGGLIMLRAASGMEGEVWASIEDQGLFRSSNSGTSFTKLANVSSARLFAFGKSPQGRTHPTVFLYGRANGSTEHGVFRSDDFGATWTDITDYDRLAAANLKSMEADRRVFGRVFIGTGGRGIRVGTATESPPYDLAIAALDATRAEGIAGTTLFTFTVTRSGGSADPASVGWAVSGTGGLDAADFVGGVLPSGTVDFAAGETSKTLSVAVSGDIAVEADETFTVTLSEPSANATIVAATADGVIVNDDAEQYDLAIAAADATRAEGDAGTTLFTFTVSRSGGSADPASVGWAVSGTGGLDAADFVGGVLPSGTVDFAAGETSKTLSVAVSGDIAIEADETFTVTLSEPSANATIVAATADGVIVNDDAEQYDLAIAAADATKPEGDAGPTEFTFTVTRSGGSADPASVGWAVSGTGGLDAADFVGGVLPSGTVDFAAGETSKTLSVAVSGDIAVEADETFTVTLSEPSANATIVAATADGLIQDDDSTPTGPTLITFRQGAAGYDGVLDTELKQANPLSAYGAATSLRVDAGTGVDTQALLRFSDLFGSGPGQIPLGATITSATLTLQVTNGSGNGGTVHRMLSDWSGGATWNSLGNGIQTDGTEAVATADTVLGSVNIGSRNIDVGASLQAWAAAGATSAEQNTANKGWLFRTPSTDAWIFNSSEGAVTPLLTVEYTLDGPQQYGLTIAAADATKPEGDAGPTEFTFTVTRSGGSADPASVGWAVSGTGGLDAADFVGGVLPSGTVDFAAGETSKTLSVAVSGDIAVEADEAFTVTLSDPSANATIVAATADGVIVNDDAEQPPDSRFAVNLNGTTLSLGSGRMLALGGTKLEI